MLKRLERVLTTHTVYKSEELGGCARNWSRNSQIKFSTEGIQKVKVQSSQSQTTIEVLQNECKSPNHATIEAKLKNGDLYELVSDPFDQLSTGVGPFGWANCFDLKNRFALTEL